MRIGFSSMSLIGLVISGVSIYLGLTLTSNVLVQIALAASTFYGFVVFSKGTYITTIKHMNTEKEIMINAITEILYFLNEGHGNTKVSVPKGYLEKLPEFFELLSDISPKPLTLDGNTIKSETASITYVEEE